MSKKSSQSKIPTLSPIANAMYNAQRKELTSSIIMSLSFFVIGVAVIIISAVKYFDISANIQDPSEKIDALAYLVFAAVGICVVAIGVINMLKSFVTLGQLGSLLKRTESHASPFQDQQLTRRVAAMNQSQAMKQAETASAEQRKSDKKKGFSFGSVFGGKKKVSSSELYDKYNPPKKSSVTAPPKAAPMMEQKFDYGINEEKELTFADEFLMKNKRDPFAQYRKDLGIQEEAPKPVEQKPQFITSAPKASHTSTTVTGGNGSSYEFDLSQINPVAANTSPTAEKKEVQQESKPEKARDKSLLSQLDFDGSSADSGNKPSAPEKTQPKSLLSQLDFDGGSADSSNKPSAPEKPQPKSLLSQLDFDGGSADNSDIPSAPEKPKPKSLLSQLDFDGGSADNSDKPSAPEKPKPKSLLSQLDFDGGSADNPIARRSNVKAVSFLSDKMSGSFADIQPAEEKQSEQTTEPSSPYGMHREEDDGIFFSTRSNNASFTQQQQKPQAKQTVSPVVAVKAQSAEEYNLDNFAPKKSQVREKKEVSSEICKNGTPSQRKYVEASEFDEWTCPQCGKVNQEYVGICACGRRKPRPRKK